MALKHDAQGFLVGDPIDLSALVAEWAGIREDVRAIRQAVLGIEQAMSRIAPESTPVAAAVPGRSTEVAQSVIAIQPVESTGAPVQHQQPEAARPAPSVASAPAASRDVRQIPVLLRTPATPQANAARGGREGAADAAVNRVVAELRATRAATLRAPVEPPRRDGRGRFVKGQEANQSKPGQRPDGSSPREEEEQDESLVRSLTDRVTGAVREASTGLEEADPAVKALSEVAQPMARGFELITGGGDQQKKQERWLRRIFNTLTGSRKEQGLFNKIAAKRLKAIEEKPEEKSGGGIFGGLLGGLGGLLMKIPIIGGLLSAGGAAAGGLGKLLLGGGKGLLRKIPILGGLLASLGAASDIYSTETDGTLTRGEKDKRTGKAAGGLAGTLGGLWAGAKLGAAVGALGGPIGAAIGGVVGGAAGMFFGDKAGQVLGETVGGWVSDLRNADIPGMISNAWATTTGTISSAWSAATAAIVSAWDSTTSAISSVWGSAVDGVQKGWDSVVAGFSEVGDSIGKKWEGFVDAAKSGWDSITSLFSSAYEGLKSLPGIGPAIEAVEGAAQKASEVVSNVVSGAKDLASSAVDKAVELGGQAAEKVQAVAQKTAEAASAVAEGAKNIAQSAWGYVTDKATDAASAVKNAVQDSTVGRGATKAWEGAAWVGDRATAAKDWVLGKTSKLFESGSGGAGTVSTGRGDHGGASYGTYQLASNTGTLKKFLDSTSYGEQFKGMTPGTREFNDKWKQIARDDPNFGDAQHEFIKQTHFDPQIERLNKAGIDLSGRGAAVKDSVWSTSVQFGGNSSLIEKALAGRDVEKMSDSEIVSTIQDYKIQNNDRLFASSSDAVRRGTLNRAHQEKERLLELAQADIQARPDERSTLAEPPAAPAAPVVAGAAMPEAISLAAPAAPVVAVASVPAVPSAPTMPPIADAPPVSVPMASGDTRKPVAVVSAPTEVGQDLRERGIAHIATGGLGKG